MKYFTIAGVLFCLVFSAMPLAAYNKDHLAKVKQGVHLWNDWRKKNAAVHIDLTRAPLQNLNLKGVNLRKADLRDANLTNTDLEKADLKDADLGGAILKNANLWGAKLMGSPAFGKPTDPKMGGADCEKAIIDVMFKPKILRRVGIKNYDKVNWMSPDRMDKIRRIRATAEKRRLAEERQKELEAQKKREQEKRKKAEAGKLEEERRRQKEALEKKKAAKRRKKQEEAEREARAAAKKKEHADYIQGLKDKVKTSGGYNAAAWGHTAKELGLVLYDKETVETISYAKSRMAAYFYKYLIKPPKTSGKRKKGPKISEKQFLKDVVMHKVDADGNTCKYVMFGDTLVAAELDLQFEGERLLKNLADIYPYAKKTYKYRGKTKTKDMKYKVKKTLYYYVNTGKKKIKMRLSGYWHDYTFVKDENTYIRLVMHLPNKKYSSYKYYMKKYFSDKKISTYPKLDARALKDAQKGLIFLVYYKPAIQEDYRQYRVKMEKSLDKKTKSLL